jgi:hypothetical protein
MRPHVLNNSAVDNLDALNRINATPIGDDVNKVIKPSSTQPSTK